MESALPKLKGPLLETTKEVFGLSSKHAWQKKTWWWHENVAVTFTNEKRSRMKAYNALRMHRNCKPHKKSALQEISKGSYLVANHVVWIAKAQASEETLKPKDS